MEDFFYLNIGTFKIFFNAPICLMPNQLLSRCHPLIHCLTLTLTLFQILLCTAVPLVLCNMSYPHALISPLFLTEFVNICSILLSIIGLTLSAFLATYNLSLLIVFLSIPIAHQLYRPSPTLIRLGDLILVNPLAIIHWFWQKYNLLKF